MGPEEFNDEHESSDRKKREEFFNERKKEINDRIKKFLNQIPYGEVEEVTTTKRKIKDILLEEGFEMVIEKLPKFLFSEMYYKSIDELYRYYLKNKDIELTDIDFENINHILNLYKDEEKYEKCQVLVKEFSLT